MTQSNFQVQQRHQKEQNSVELNVFHSAYLTLIDNWFIYQ
jgi:hypothetical protein